MATFNIHPASQCLRELINTRAFEFESATEIASSVAVLEELKCARCSRLVVEDFNWCQTGETIPHSICRQCKVYKEEVARKTLSTCPIIKKEQDKAVSCGRKLVGFENGVLRYMDIFLNMWRFPCGAEQYGCTFVGTKEELRAHEVSQCTYKYLRVCSKPKLYGNTGELCGKVFNSHLELSQHLETHGIKQQHLDESTHVLSFKDINDLTEEWVVIDKRLMDCPNGQFCTLMVCENNTEIRLWLQEIKSKEDDARGVKSQLYFARIPARDFEFPKLQHCCQAWVLPYDMTDGFAAFEIKKNFLRQNADCQLDGNIHFNVKFQFFDILSLAASPNSTDAEIETPSTQSVTKQKGALDDAVQPDDVDKSIAAKLLLSANDVDGISCAANVGDVQVPVVKQNILDTVIQPAVQKKPDVVVQPAVQKKPDAVVQPAVQKNPDAVIQPAVQKKPDAVIQPTVQKKPDAVIQPMQKKPDAVVQPAVQKKPDVVVQPAVQKKPDAVIQPAVQKKPDAVVQPAVQKKPDVVVQPAVQKKPDAVIQPMQKKPDTVVQPAVQKTPDAEPNPFDGGFQPVRTWPMEKPSTGDSQAQPSEPKLPPQGNPHPQGEWKSYESQKSKDVQRHGRAESKDFKVKMPAGKGSSQPPEGNRLQGSTRQSRTMWKSRNVGKGNHGSGDNKDTGQKSIAGDVTRQETFPPAHVGNPAAAKKEKADDTSAETNPHSPFRAPQSTEAAAAVDLPVVLPPIGGQTRGRNQQVCRKVATVAYKDRWMAKPKNQDKDSSQ